MNFLNILFENIVVELQYIFNAGHHYDLSF